MSRLCRTFAFVVALIALAGSALAETILLKDGSRMTGTIVGADADSIRFQTPDGVLTIRRERIQSIDYGTAAPSVPAPAAAAAPTAQPAPGATEAKAAAPESKASSFQFILEPGYRFSFSEADGGFAGNVAAMSRVSPVVSVGVSVGLAHFNNKVRTLSKGDVTVIPIMARTVVRAPEGLSLEAGLGFAFSSHNLDAEVTSGLAALGLSLEEDIQPAIAAEISFGYTSTPQAAVSGGIFIGYQLHSPNVDVTVTDLVFGGGTTGQVDVSLSAPFVRAFFSF